MVSAGPQAVFPLCNSFLYAFCILDNSSLSPQPLLRQLCLTPVIKLFRRSSYPGDIKDRPDPHAPQIHQAEMPFPTKQTA